MLGSPVGGASYLFVDPTSVWRREPEEAKVDDKGRGAQREEEREGDGTVTVLLPSERDPARQVSPTTGIPTSTTYTFSHQPLTNFPHLPHHQHQQESGVLPGFVKRRSVRVPGWELYAVDGWVMDRARKWCCVVTCGDRREPSQAHGPNTNGHGGSDGEGSKSPGVLMDEYIPITTTSHRHTSHDESQTDEEDFEPWHEALQELQMTVQADGGRLEQVDVPSNPSSKIQPKTTCLLPVTPLPYLPHGLIPIPIPSGRYTDARDELFVNLGLRRLGCSGRSSVGLGVPR